MMIRDNGLLFWATLYFPSASCRSPIVIVFLTVSVSCRFVGGGVDVVVARTGRTVAAVIAVSTDETAAVAVPTVALVARHRPRGSHVWTVERRQHNADHDDDGCCRQETQPTAAEHCSESRSRSHAAHHRDSGT